MKILFLSLSGLTYDVSTPEREPLGGTESSFCYLARELAKTHDVTLSSKNSQNVTIYGVKHHPNVDMNNFDVVISNAPVQLNFKRKFKYIFWSHLAHFDAAIKTLLLPDVFQQIDCIVYVSDWQRREFEKQFGKAKQPVVIGNGLTPSFENMFSSVDDLAIKDPASAVYTSTPYRGLRLLPAIMKQLSGMRLDAYTGLVVYQNKDNCYDGLYQSVTSNVITLHGNVSQIELASRLKNASTFIYPCVFPETYCIAALEAMAAGLHVVTTNTGALPNTLHGFGVMAREEDTDEDTLVERMVTAVNYARYAISADDLFKQVQYANDCCTWRERAKQWDSLFEALWTP